MKKYIICSVYNQDTFEFSGLLLEKSKKSAVVNFIRTFEQAMKKDKHLDVTDYILYMLGTFDIETGEIDVIDKVSLTSGLAEFKAKENIIDEFDDDDDDDDDE